MTSTESFATRLSSREAERIHEAVEETGLSRSELIGWGFRWYMAKNPNNIPAFRLVEPEVGPLAELDILPPMTESD